MYAVNATQIRQFRRFSAHARDRHRRTNLNPAFDLSAQWKGSTRGCSRWLLPVVPSAVVRKRIRIRTFSDSREVVDEQRVGALLGEGLQDMRVEPAPHEHVVEFGPRGDEEPDGASRSRRARSANAIALARSSQGASWMITRSGIVVSARVTSASVAARR